MTSISNINSNVKQVLGNYLGSVKNDDGEALIFDFVSQQREQGASAQSMLEIANFAAMADGQVDKKEQALMMGLMFSSMLEKLGIDTSMFNFADSDASDGTVGGYEYASTKADGSLDLVAGLDKSVESVKGLDKDNDGVVSLEEAGPGSELFDLDNDGKISAREDLALSLFQDTNKDGKISDEEYNAFDKKDAEATRSGLVDVYNQFIAPDKDGNGTEDLVDAWLAA